MTHVPEGLAISCKRFEMFGNSDGTSVLRSEAASTPTLSVSEGRCLVSNLRIECPSGGVVVQTSPGTEALHVLGCIISGELLLHCGQLHRCAVSGHLSLLADSQQQHQSRKVQMHHSSLRRQVPAIGL